jgi:uncharacterized protein (TIGR02594 family)
MLDYHSHSNSDYKRMLWAYPRGDDWPKNALIAKFHQTAGTAVRTASGKEFVDDDETNWCAAFINWCIEIANSNRSAPLEKRNSWALSFQNWGSAVDIDSAEAGDLVVFEKMDAEGKITGGHVGFYEGHDNTHVTVLGGNQYYDDELGRGPSSRPTNTYASTIVSNRLLRDKMLNGGTVSRTIKAVRRAT